MRSLSRSLRELRGWRRMLTAMLAGALSALAMAPVFAWPVLALTLPALVWLIDGAVAARASAQGAPTATPGGLPCVPRTRKAAWIGWCFGFGYFLAGLYWIGEAFLVEAERFAWLLPFAVSLMPAGLALFFALGTALAQLAWSNGPMRVLALALGLSASEWLRGHVLTGFPWNTLGYALTWPDPLLQAAAWLGIYGLTLVTVVALCAPAVAWLDAEKATDPMALRRAAVLVPVLLLLPLFAGGHMRLAEAEASMNDHVRLRLVQPSIPQRDKWRPELQGRIFAEHLRLSATNQRGEPAGLTGITLVIWPEAAMPFLPLEHPDVLQAIANLLPKGVQLVSGALRIDRSPGASGQQRRLIFNSLIAFDDEGRPAAIYDKVHLVPFGEFLPLQATLEAIGLEQLSRMKGGFDSGLSPRPLLSLANLPPFGPLICYEVIFPTNGFAGQKRPAFLLNLTNDGWFGHTSGPYQHLHQTRVRAVMEGLPVIRVANNGVSAVIDGKGRILQSLPLNARGVIETGLPPALPPTFSARFGDLFFLFAEICGFLLIAFRRNLRRYSTI
ncbi:MAG: apolipoprotein N-acyltransferase [Hyphomicrobiaceae bacterium]